MYSTNNLLVEQEFNQLQIKQLIRSESYEVLSITLEADCQFPEHVSPRDAHLLVLQGEIDFKIKNETFRLSTLQALDFEANVKHYVKAITNSRFLIIR